MAGSPAKRVIGTLLFTLALVVFLGFIFLLFANSKDLSEVPGADEVNDIGPIAAIILGVIALLMLILLVVRGLDRRAERAALAEAYYIPEEDRAAMQERKRSAFDQAFATAPGPAPSPPDVKVYHLPLVPLADTLWADVEPRRQGNDHPLYFPRSVESGVYVNDYIEIDRKGNRLKLRTLLAGTEDYPEVGSDAARKHEEEAAKVPEPEPEPDEAPPEAAKEPERERPERPGRPDRPAAESKPAPGTIGGRTSELPGDRFMRELEERSQRRAEEETSAATIQERNNVHYDFPGDVHYVEDVEGIGPVFGKRLRDAGVHTTARLCFEDPIELSVRIDAPTKTVRLWQITGELMKVDGIGPQYAEALARAGIGGIDELKKRNATDIARQVNDYLEGLKNSVLGGSITEKRVQGWQEKAKKLRRVRMKVPSE